MIALSDAEFKQFRDFIEKSCGISLGDEKAYLVENRLVGLLTETGAATFGELYRKAVNEPQLGLRDKIVDAMTTNETSWFRDLYPFSIFENTILKQFTQEIASGKRKRIRIWCAACSTGQEPYSLAMTLQEFSRKVSPQVLQCTEIIATDISPSVLFLAIAGRYDQISMSRGMPQELRDRYFTNSGKVWLLNDKIRKMVTFKKLNLQDDFAQLGVFDVVFCRNVLIYFSESFKRRLFERFAGLLNSGGIFFLGASESVSNYSNRFIMVQDNKHIYYKLDSGVRQ
ncbi:MAG TPA: protein-glutamate O-methyltransferase CheR [Chitinivibrionales bacterium]